jgi:glutathione S-transferase
MTHESGPKLSRRNAIGVVGLAAAAGALEAVGARAALPADKVTIYHVEGRRSQRIIWLCEELNIPYEVMFKRGDILGSLNQIKAVNPTMPLAPTVIFRGKMMVESGGIIEYLMSQFPGGEKLAPAISSPDYADYKMWIHFAEGSAACRIGAEATRIMATGDKTIRPAMLGGVYKIVGAQDMVDYIEKYIATRPYFAGNDFSSADLMMDFVATYISSMPFDPATYQNLAQWQKKVRMRPAYLRAASVGQPDGLDKFRIKATPK